MTERTDSERLEFMIDKQARIVRHLNGWIVVIEGADIAMGMTPRAAIDAAMDREGE